MLTYGVQQGSTEGMATPGQRSVPGTGGTGGDSVLSSLRKNSGLSANGYPTEGRTGGASPSGPRAGLCLVLSLCLCLFLSFSLCLSSSLPLFLPLPLSEGWSLPLSLSLYAGLWHFLSRYICARMRARVHTHTHTYTHSDKHTAMF